MTGPDVALIWSYLSGQPLLWLIVTLAGYGIGVAAQTRAGGRAWVNPVLVAMVVVGAILTLSRTPYQVYFEGAQFVHFMLGPATVALALPLYDNRAAIAKAVVPIAAGLLAGSVVAVTSALGIAAAFGLEGGLLASLAPKSTTAPVAIGIAEALGGQPTITAVLVILTGVWGAMIGAPLLDLLGIRDRRARGLAIGTAAHGIGTARAFQAGQVQGTFSGIGMGLNAVLTAILAPLVLALFL